MITDLPSYVHLDFANVSGQNAQLDLLVSPFSEEELKQEAIKQVALDVIKNPVVWISIGGGIVAGAGIGGLLVANGIIVNAVAGYAIGAAIGGTVAGSVTAGLVARSKLAAMREAFINDVKLVRQVLPKYKPTIQMTMNLFIREQLERASANNISLFCPISAELMIFPVRVCNSDVPHIYDIKSIAAWIKNCIAEGNNPNCPTCRTDLNVTEFIFDSNIREILLGAIQGIFISLEKVLQKMPNNLFSNSLNFQDKNILRQIADKVNHNVEILTSPNDLLNKLKNPDQLTEEEVYAVAYNLILTFKPLLVAVRRIGNEVKSELGELALNDVISDEASQAKQREVETWTEEFKNKVIPKECKIISKIAYTRIGT